MKIGFYAANIAHSRARSRCYCMVKGRYENKFINAIVATEPASTQRDFTAFEREFILMFVTLKIIETFKFMILTLVYFSRLCLLWITCFLTLASFLRSPISFHPRAMMCFLFPTNCSMFPELRERLMGVTRR